MSVPLLSILHYILVSEKYSYFSKTFWNFFSVSLSCCLYYIIFQQLIFYSYFFKFFWLLINNQLYLLFLLPLYYNVCYHLKNIPTFKKLFSVVFVSFPCCDLIELLTVINCQHFFYNFFKIFPLMRCKPCIYHALVTV